MTTMLETQVDRRLFRRQFVLGPRPLSTTASWSHHAVGEGLVLQVHPDLALTRVEAAGFELTLLGYAIDPYQESRDDEAILRSLTERMNSAREASREAADLGGRFVMIVHDGLETVVFHDPCGTREVFYTTGEHRETWVASQPSILVEEFGLQVDDEYRRRFMESDYFRNHPERVSPGDLTPYRDLRHLTPNHLLHLESRSVRRYWPTQEVETLAPEVAAERVAGLLRASLRGISQRFPLALPLTAGVDSRTILAATRDLEDIFHFTARRHPLTRRSPDLAVPGRLLRSLGREHHVVDCPREMSGAFADLYRRNVSSTHESAGAIAQGLSGEFPAGHVSLSGHCAEIARDTFGVTHLPVEDVGQLADCVYMKGNEFAEAQFDRWLVDARRIHAATGHRIWDLFFWEHEYGTWAANGQSQWDMIHERFTPFNSRPILTALLAVDPQHRQGPEYPIFPEIMRILWPEVLSEPFNPREPMTLLTRAERKARRVLRGALSTEVGRALRSGVALFSLK